jgi:hypothetical protein
MVAGPPPGRAPAVEGSAGPEAEPTAERHLRFAGSLRGIDVEVRGAGPVVVSQDRAAGRIVIVTGDVTVMLREAAAGREQGTEQED